MFAGPAGLRRENESGKRQFRQLEATAVLDSVLGKVSEKQSYTLGRGEGGQLNQKEVLGSLTAGEEALEWVGSGGTQGGWWAAGRPVGLGPRSGRDVAGTELRGWWQLSSEAIPTMGWGGLFL